MTVCLSWPSLLTTVYGTYIAAGSHCHISDCVAVLSQDGQRRGVPGLDERGTYISACRLPKNYTQLAEGIR